MLDVLPRPSRLCKFPPPLASLYSQYHRTCSALGGGAVHWQHVFLVQNSSVGHELKTPTHVGLCFSEEGDLYGWGKNRMVVLGLGHHKDQFFPFKVRSSCEHQTWTNLRHNLAKCFERLVVWRFPVKQIL